MEPSKVTVNYFRKKLRSQKRKTILMFFIGILFGGAIGFNLYYWYPLLQKQFDLPKISQFGKPSKQITKKTTESTVKETTETSEVEVEKEFEPRTNMKNVQGVETKYQPLNQKLEQVVSEYKPSGTILTVKDNKVVLFENYGNAAESNANPIESTYMIASIQKMLTSILVMNLIEEGKLTLETPLSTFYPDIPNSSNITMDQLLSMTSGLVLKEKLKNSNSKEESINYVVKNVTYEPTDKWRYSDVNFFLLGAITEQLSGKSYEQYFEEIIRNPLNLDHTGFYQPDNIAPTMVSSYKMSDEGAIDNQPVSLSASSLFNELGTGNIYISTGDFLTIIQAMFDGKLVSRDVLDKTMNRKPADYPYRYKAGFYDKDEGYYYGHGIFQSYEPTVLFNKDASSAVIYFSNIFTKDKSNVDLANRLYNEVTQFVPND